MIGSLLVRVGPGLNLSGMELAPPAREGHCLARPEKCENRPENRRPGCGAAAQATTPQKLIPACAMTIIPELPVLPQKRSAKRADNKTNKLHKFYILLLH
ncbi:MAG: hypothetical protein ACREEJ_27720 [Ensifer adhaerens]